ncbi:MAG: hypothetical protein N3A66_11490, partial [Planctomycetota bacterium]|nr:hypothetical protein [Planctomycetota bacterium]
LQIASITPAEVLVCVPGESEPVASPATEEPAKGKKDAKASEFEWDPREWVESIFADSRPITRQTGEM